MGGFIQSLYSIDPNSIAYTREYLWKESGSEIRSLNRFKGKPHTHFVFNFIQAGFVGGKPDETFI